MYQVDELVFKPHTPPLMIPEVAELFEESGNYLPALEHANGEDFIVATTPLQLPDQLFLIQCNPEDTMCRQ